MLDNRMLWIVLGASLLALYAAGLVLAVQGQLGHVLVRLSVIILAAHLLEIPLAFRRLRGKEASPARVMGLTFVFGLVWWLPASRGVFAVR
jgi:hypothetical protein